MDGGDGLNWLRRLSAPTWRFRRNLAFLDLQLLNLCKDPQLDFAEEQSF